MRLQRVGHRGAPREFPGNTLRGFARAVEYGCTMIECDIRQAADGVPVLAHDPEVVDVAGNRYIISEAASKTLAALDLGAGEGVPTLENLVTWANGRCAVMADMKCEGNGVEERVAAVLAPLAMDAKVVPGAGVESRKRFRALDPGLPLSLTLARNADVLSRPGGFQALVSAIDTEAVTWEYPLLTGDRILKLHEHRLKVYAWTVDDADIMRQLVAAGVDGIISNRPDLVTRLS